jgi:hypothetical protein
MSMKNTGRRGLFGLLAAAPVAAVAAPAQAEKRDRIVTANEMGTSICNALGIPTDQITRISLDCNAGDLAKVEIERAVYVREARELHHVLSHYALVERS